MPSLRSKLINAIVRHTAKRRLLAMEINAAAIAQTRAGLDRFGASVKPARGQRRESGQLGGVATEFTRIAAPRGIVYYCHGGGYIVGSPLAYRRFANRLVTATGYDMAIIDYRLAPEHPFPAAPDDALAGYRALIDSGHDPRQIVIAGDSAGGNLALVTLLRIKESGLPLPSGAVLLSPWTDLTGSGDSVRGNAEADPMLPANRIAEAAAMYARDHDLAHPHVSPLFGDFAGLPPVAIHVGSTEILLDDARRVAQRMSDAQIKVWKEMPHVFPIFADVLPEGRRAINYISAFIESVRA